ncbi:MAG: TetR family transcriptional regulator [Bacteroidetes bacterium]|jgi:AcrR family transcriptional regulator|nr:TetR family transcriptional regulator [Bacteroidota bacterium]
MNDKHKHILEAAEQLFAEKGFNGTSVRDIAGAAGVNIAMISYYFGSKENLMIALIDYRSEYTRDILEEMNNNKMLTPWDKIEKLIDLYVDKILNNYRFYRIMTLHLATSQSDEIREKIIEIKAGNFELIKKIILEGQRKNVFRKIDMELTIGTVMGTIAQVTSSRSLYCKLLKIDIKDDDGYRKKMTLKLRTHLKQMLKAHLHIQNT